MPVTQPGRRLLWWGASVVAAVAVVLTGVRLLGMLSPSGPAEPLADETNRRTSPHAQTDPRLTRATPFQNVHPDVKYVGDQVCARCHERYMQTYREHPMGRSLATIDEALPVQPLGTAAQNPFERPGLRYHIEKRDGKVWHRETSVDSLGSVVSVQEAPVHFAVGSSSHGRSYLIERDGALFMSPITWYPEKARWDLSPGYGQVNQHFGRPITKECLFCHCNHADSVAESINRYHKPIFKGLTIGCERCHGPGALHVQRREREPDAPEPDNTIVHPRRLEPLLREAICQQCHLSGASRIARPGVGTFDYRPGLPLHAFLSVFVRAPELTDNQKFVGQFEQMRASRCYRASAGKLDCVSCHDPHAKPSAETRVAFYRQRCVACHESRGCSVPELERRKQSAEDSCIQCHMPRMDADITHVSISDHRVLRRPDRAGSGPAKPFRGPPLVHFHQNEVPGEDPGRQRDLGLAMMDLGSRSSGASETSLQHMALPLLEAARQRDPQDLEVMEAYALSLAAVSKLHEASELLAEVLRRQPRREATLDAAASVAMQAGRNSQAIEYWSRATRLNPHRWRYQAGLANAHAGQREWSQAVHAAERALALHHLHLETRLVLVVACLERGDRERARRELEILLRLDPPDAAELRKRFASLLAEGQAP